VFSLFNLKEKSRFWSESVIHSGGMLCLCFFLASFFFFLHFRFEILDIQFIFVSDWYVISFDCWKQILMIWNL
jgi:hypothetical protein